MLEALPDRERDSALGDVDANFPLDERWIDLGVPDFDINPSSGKHGYATSLRAHGNEEIVARIIKKLIEEKPAPRDQA